jgi:phosphatidylserine decarboxylase
MKASLFIPLQYLLPQHLLSRIVGRMASCKVSLVKNTFISWFIKRYKVDMSEAAEPDASTYVDFNSFFTRALRNGARPINTDATRLICPADGAISQLGAIEHDRIFQAKGRSFSVQALLGGDSTLAAEFTDGSFATVYLSPRDYHRVHMPMAATLRSMIYVPGKLFSVNTMASEHVNALFARNERVVCVFDTSAGPMALVLVGAMIVAGVETVWAGHVCPDRQQLISTDYQNISQPIVLDKGMEMGRFKLGSSVVAVFGPGMVQWDAALAAGAPVRMGQIMGAIHTQS